MYYKLLILNKKIVFLNTKVFFVKIYYINNRLEIYPNHSPLLGIIKNKSFLFLQKKKLFHKYELYDSLIEFSNNKLTILVEKLIFIN